MTSPCTEWHGYRDRQGYGRTYSNGRTAALAHRVAYEKAHGPIPDGMTVDHLCFNRSCVNPAHLRLLTHSENVRNQRSARKTHCVRDHEFTPENTYIKGDGRDGRRICRACNRESAARYRNRKSA